MADTEDFDTPGREGWLASKQRAWATAPGTPPRGAKPPAPDGSFGGSRYTLGILGLLLVGVLSFGSLVAYTEATHSEESGGHSEQSGAEGGAQGNTDLTD